jgi:hypothetical protein
VKIVVEEGQAQSPSDPSEQHARSEYEVDLDYEGALSILRRLRSSGSYIHFGAQNYRIHFRLDPSEPIEVEIMSIIDDFWAMSEVTDSQAESILGVAYRGEKFSGVIPGSEMEWGGWSDGSGLPR